MKFKIVHGRIGSDIWANTRLKIISNLIKPINKKILDLGCGSGYIGMEYVKNNNVVFADNNKEELAKISVGSKVLINATDIHLKKETFDIIFCTDVLEHIKNDKKVLENIYKILKKEGIVVITVPAYKKFYGHHDSLIGHYRRYDKEDIIKIIEPIGFKIKHIRYLCSILFFPFLLNQFLIQ